MRGSILNALRRLLDVTCFPAVPPHAIYFRLPQRIHAYLFCELEPGKVRIGPNFNLRIYATLFIDQPLPNIPSTCGVYQTYKVGARRIQFLCYRMRNGSALLKATAKTLGQIRDEGWAGRGLALVIPMHLRGFSASEHVGLDFVVFTQERQPKYKGIMRFVKRLIVAPCKCLEKGRGRLSEGNSIVTQYTASSPETDFEPANILLIDENESRGEQLAEELRSHGQYVIQVKNTKKAIQMLRRTGGVIQVVLVNLPQNPKDGIACFRSINKATNGLAYSPKPRILCHSSSFLDPSVEMEVTRCGTRLLYGQ